MEVYQRSRTHLLGKAASLRAGMVRRKHFWEGLNRLAWVTMLLLVAIVMSGYGFYNVAAHTLPGDQLYPVKRTLESIHLQVASAQARPELEETYNHRRLSEVQALVRNKRAGQSVSFWGVLEEKNDARWVVDSVPVHLASDVRIIGQIEVGVTIEVEGETTPEGWVLAHELHLNRRDWVGDVENITSTQWTVSGLTFQVSDATKIEGAPQVGNPVLVTILAEEDGSMLAMRITRLTPLDPSQTPQVLPTPLPTYTPTATPISPSSRIEIPTATPSQLSTSTTPQVVAPRETEVESNTGEETSQAHENSPTVDDDHNDTQQEQHDTNQESEHEG